MLSELTDIYRLTWMTGEDLLVLTPEGHLLGGPGRQWERFPENTVSVNPDHGRVAVTLPDGVLVVARPPD
ncbi:hypothetical protein [Actinoplanes couchii]|uniref:hypothetical protein n=1 Tax=Actinoplanes couchii TaxID=403638 RepID=UPI001943FCFB|nr:hypothetical protein [Actinoplanes couchii]MDR6322525.1 hypothetical protein [Actinoplanes couchii]